MSSSDAFPTGPHLPDVDERVVAPESGYEIYDGLLVHVAPADERHGSRHSKISALVEAHVAADFDVATHLLTRTSETTDIAPDVSVFPYARDPVTGGRQVEHLAFEIVNTDSLGLVGERAAKLATRGVRRVFVIELKRGRALEWASSPGSWNELDPSAPIEDPTLAAPLPIEALLRAAKADDAMARALSIKNNPVIEAIRAQSKLEGLAEAVVGILDARGISPGTTERARILAERDPARLSRWIARAATCATATAVFAEP